MAKLVLSEIGELIQYFDECEDRFVDLKQRFVLSILEEVIRG